MQGFEKHRLTSRERKVVIAVAIFMLLLLIAWFTAIVLLLPNPGHGTL